MHDRDIVVLLIVLLVAFVAGTAIGIRSGVEDMKDRICLIKGAWRVDDTCVVGDRVVLRFKE
jgi:hypothetical protein